MPSYNPSTSYTAQAPAPHHSASVAFGGVADALNPKVAFFPQPAIPLFQQGQQVDMPLSPLSESSDDGYDSPVPFEGYPSPPFVPSSTPVSPPAPSFDAPLTYAPSIKIEPKVAPKSSKSRGSKPYDRPATRPTASAAVVTVTATPVTGADDENTISIGTYTKAERRRKIERFREKWLKAFPGWKPGQKRTIVYHDRKKFAESRPRVGGRFIKGERKSDKIKAEKAAAAKAAREAKTAAKLAASASAPAPARPTSVPLPSLPSTPVFSPAAPRAPVPTFDRSKLPHMDVSDDHTPSPRVTVTTSTRSSSSPALITGVPLSQANAFAQAQALSWFLHTPLPSAHGLFAQQQQLQQQQQQMAVATPFDYPVPVVKLEEPASLPLPLPEPVFEPSVSVSVSDPSAFGMGLDSTRNTSHTHTHTLPMPFHGESGLPAPVDMYGDSYNFYPQQYTNTPYTNYTTSGYSDAYSMQAASSFPISLFA